MMQSYYERALRLGEATGDEGEFQGFALGRVDYYVGFYKKWVASPRPDDFVLSYEELTEDTEQTVGRVIAFIQDNGWIRKGRLKRILDKLPSKATFPRSSSQALRDPRKYRTQAKLLAKIEARIAAECGTEHIRYYFLT
jgi:hypothetical protein